MKIKIMTIPVKRLESHNYSLAGRPKSVSVVLSEQMGREKDFDYNNFSEPPEVGDLDYSGFSVILKIIQSVIPEGKWFIETIFLRNYKTLEYGIEYRISQRTISEKGTAGLETFFRNLNDLKEELEF